MSKTYSLACMPCRISLWVGQGTARKPHGWRVYTTPEAIGALEAFLMEHKGHPLTMFDDESLPLDVTEIEQPLEESAPVRNSPS